MIFLKPITIEEIVPFMINSVIGLFNGFLRGEGRFNLINYSYYYSLIGTKVKETTDTKVLTGRYNIQLLSILSNV